MKYKISSVLLGVVLFSGLFICSTVHGEFYEYKDSNGVKRFTDDAGAIPVKNREKARIYSDRFDGMSSEEKVAIIRDEEEKSDEMKKNQKKESAQHGDWLRNEEYLERQTIERRKSAERERQYEKLRQLNEENYRNRRRTCRRTYDD
jgi:3-oxoacyl-[acyl-carrier-protein] synthase III